MKNIIYCILTVFCIINIIISFRIITNEQVFLKVNKDNKQIIISALNDKVEDIEKVKKISVGQGWHTGELNVYYSFGNTENLLIYEGSNFGNIDSYVRENGYSLDYVALILGSFSVITLIILVFSKIIKSVNH